jgi:hypothetical protein
MRQIQIPDPVIASELDSKGYIVLPGIDAEVVTALRRAVYEEIRTARPDKVNFNTGADLTGPMRNFAFECITKAFSPVLDRYFHGYDCIVGLIFVKRPSTATAGQIHLHCDPTLLPDENQQKHLNIWSPLIDVDETNGALWVVPGAHKVFAPVHAFSVPSQFARITDTVMEHGRCIPMKAGDILVFDNRMPHFSRQNWTDADRPAAVLSMVPSGSEFISLFGTAEGEFSIEVYRHQRNWYEDTDWIDDASRPKTGEFLGRLKWSPSAVSREEFIERIKRGAGPEYRFELLGAASGLRS